MKPAETLVQLCERVWLPLLAGGDLRPVSPIGRKRAMEILECVPGLSAPSLDEIRARRLHVARRLAALDALPDPSFGEWLLLMALNDLLQVTNPTLVGVFAADRPKQLVAEVQAMVNQASAPTNLGDAISRHASFSRVLELTRVDTHVSWWVGKQTFRGAAPAKRLLRWKSVRRVREQEERVELVSMARPEEPWAADFQEAVSTLLHASPLTDLALADREQPPFVWTGATLALIATDAGRTLAARALGRVRGKKRALAAIRELPRDVVQSSAPDALRLHQAVSAFIGHVEPSAASAAER